jgi:hypothetical protein
MNETLRMMAVGATGAIVATAVLIGQPALAGIDAKSAVKNSVTSKSIKDGAIKTKDLNAEVTGPLAKAGTALQSVPDNGVTNPKLADNAVTNPKLADNAVGSAEVAQDSLTAQDLGDNSVSGNEINGNAVSSGEVNNHSLIADDIAAQNGVSALNFTSIPANTCDTLVILTANTSLAGDLILVTPGFNWPSGLALAARPQAALGGNILLEACNRTGAAVDPPATDIGYAVIEN